MTYGHLEVDDDGRLVCHECGRSYLRLPHHLRAAHDLTADEYRDRHGLGLTTPLWAADQRAAAGSRARRPEALARLEQVRDLDALAAARGGPQWRPETLRLRREQARAQRREIPAELIAQLPSWDDRTAWTAAAQALVDEGWPQIAIARAVGQKQGTVWKRLRRARPDPPRASRQFPPQEMKAATVGRQVLTDQDRHEIRVRALAGETAAEIAPDYPAAERTIQTITRGLGRELRMARQHEVADLLHAGKSVLEASAATGIPTSTITRWARRGELRGRDAQEVPARLIAQLPRWGAVAAWTAAATSILDKGYSVAALARTIERPYPTVAKRLRDGRVREEARDGVPAPRHGHLDLHDGALICHECGTPLRALPNHIQSVHGLSSSEYRQRHGLDPGVPLIAPDVSARLTETSSRLEQLERLVAAREASARARRGATTS